MGNRRRGDFYLCCGKNVKIAICEYILEVLNTLIDVIKKILGESIRYR